MLDDLDEISANPLLQAQDTKKKTVGNRLVGNLGLDISLAKGLTFSPSFAINHSQTSLDIFWPVTSTRGLLFNGEANKRSISNEQWVQNNVLTYLRNWDEHSATIMVGSSFENNKTSLFGASASKFPIPALNTDYMQSAIIGSVPESFVNDYQLASFFARGNYSFNDKYYITANKPSLLICE